EWPAEIYMAAAAAMAQRGKLNGVADEGGVWPDFAGNEEGLEALTQAIEVAGFRAGSDAAIALDVAASSIFTNGRYRLALDGSALDSDGMIELLCRWVDDYPIGSLEDPLSEGDDAGFTEITRRLGRRCQIIGDDYL